MYGYNNVLYSCTGYTTNYIEGEQFDAHEFLVKLLARFESESMLVKAVVCSVELRWQIITCWLNQIL